MDNPRTAWKSNDASYSDGGKSDWLSEYLSLPAREKASIYFFSNQIVFICYFTRCSRDQSIWHTCNWFDIKFWQHASCADTKREKSNNLNKGKGGSRELVCGWMGGYNFFESEGKRTFPGPNVQEARCSRMPRISKLIKKVHEHWIIIYYFEHLHLSWHHFFATWLQTQDRENMKRLSKKANRTHKSLLQHKCPHIWKGTDAATKNGIFGREKIPQSRWGSSIWRKKSQSYDNLAMVMTVVWF